MIHLEPPSYELLIIQKKVAEEIQIMFLRLLFTMKRSVSLDIMPRNHERLQRKSFHWWKVFMKNNFVAVKGPAYLWYIYILYIYIYIYMCVCVCVLWKNNTFSLTPSKCCFFCTFVNIAIRRLKTTATSFYWSPALAFTSGVLQLWEFPNVRVEIFWLTRVLEKVLGSIYNKIKSIYRQVCW